MILPMERQWFAFLLDYCGDMDDDTLEIIVMMDVVTRIYSEVEPEGEQQEGLEETSLYLIPGTIRPTGAIDTL